MSEETYDEAGEAEEMVSEELTSEELFEQRKAEIDALFEERGFFRRMGDMFSGLGKPRSSREYKIARTELQRLMAPLVAILLPVIGVVSLIVITAVTDQNREIITLDIAKVQEEDTPLEEEAEPEPEPPPEQLPDEVVDVVVDTPVVGPIAEVATPVAAPTEPVSVKPAQEDSVAIIKSPVKFKGISGSRTPGMIGTMTRGGAGYGDKTTEAAVLKAMRWLKHTQRANGSWPGPISNTGLAVLTYLAHGETPGSKEFGTTVEKALQHLIKSQYIDKSGVCRFKGTDSNEYAFLIATYALCEAYGMTHNPNVKEVAMKALSRIVNNQSPTGGYDYKINKESTRDDLSFAGWALQALKAGKMAGLHPEGLEPCIKKAIKYLKTRAFVNGGFGYCAKQNPTGLTATGCLAMQLLGYGDQKEVVDSLDSMRKWLPVFESKEKFTPGGPCPGQNAQYYCYYAAQCKYQAGMKQGATQADVKAWQEWNLAMKKLYPSAIITLDQKIDGPDGKQHAMGYWKYADPTCQAGGPTMGTALCALQLMVYYRYLPTTQTKAGAIERDDDGAKGKKPARKSNDVDVEVDI